jgi:hypothetical protein
VPRSQAVRPALPYSKIFNRNFGETAFDQTLFQKLTTLGSESETKAQELGAAIKAQMAARDGTTPNRVVRRLVREARKVQADFLREVRRVQSALGISEAEIRAIERAHDAQLLPPTDGRFWRTQIEQTLASESEDLDGLAETGLKRLLTQVNAAWLRTEARKPYRLGSEFITSPLHLVNGVRCGNRAARAKARKGSLGCCS